MPPKSHWPKWAKAKHARDFTSFATIEDELRKKTHHGALALARALKAAKTFDDGKAKRKFSNSRDDEALATHLRRTKSVDIDAVARACADDVANGVRHMVSRSRVDDGREAAAGDGDGEARVQGVIDVDAAFDARDVVTNVFALDERPFAIEGGARDDGVRVAAKRLASSSRVGREIEALRERLLAIARLANRAVDRKNKKTRDAVGRPGSAREGKTRDDGGEGGREKRRDADADAASASASEEDEEANDNASSSASAEESDLSDADESGYVSLSEETLAEMRAFKREAKTSAKKAANDGGGEAEADAEVEALDLAPKKKKIKKRMGQRKRREIAVAKFGANAAHLIAERERASAEARAKEEEERAMHPSWRAKRERAPLIVASAGKKVKFGEDEKKLGTGDGGKPRGKPSFKPPTKSTSKTYAPKTEIEGPLHPSWQAKLKADAQAWGGGGVKPEGKKVVFDD